MLVVDDVGEDVEAFEVLSLGVSGLRFEYARLYSVDGLSYGLPLQHGLPHCGGVNG